MGDTPVLIPNTMVKTQTADGTALETMWESRWPPDLIKEAVRRQLPLLVYYRCYITCIVMVRDCSMGL